MDISSHFNAKRKIQKMYEKKRVSLMLSLLVLYFHVYFAIKIPH